MIEKAEFTIRKGGVRLDAALLANFPHTTRAFARSACEDGSVKVNGRPGQKGMKLKTGDVIQVGQLAEECDNRPFPDVAVRPDLIFEDADLLAFDKPAGMPVQPLTRKEKGTLANGVVARWPECVQAGDQPLMAGALHRIDADTSGLVIFARNAAAFNGLRNQFSEHRVRKTYLALVEGTVAVGGKLEHDLAHMPGLGYCKMVDPSRARLSKAEERELSAKAMHAVTEYRPIGYARCGCEDRTLLEVTIHTGVTHQIRAQLALAGMHIVNDRLYGAFAVENVVGHCLHALSASFSHPVSGNACEVCTRYPDWAAKVLAGGGED